MNTPTARRAALYARVSTAGQDVQRQLVELRAYAKRAGLHVVGEFSETVSGAKTSSKARPERERVTALARRRNIDCVLVLELTRWSRSTRDLIDSITQLDAWGVSLVALNGLQFDLATPQGKLFAQLIAALGEFERDLIRERVKSGLAAARLRGVRLGRREGFAPTLKKKGAQVREMRADGKSIRAIARELQISTGTVQRAIAQ